MSSLKILGPLLSVTGHLCDMLLKRIRKCTLLLRYRTNYISHTLEHRSNFHSVHVDILEEKCPSSRVIPCF